MNAKKINENAVAEVVGFIAKCDRLGEGDIKIHDNYPAYDGEILIYENEVQKIENMRIVKIQIKGKIVSGKFPNSEISFSNVEKSALSAYSQNRGVLYFVVYMNERAERQLYYKELFVPEINEILKKDQKTYTIKLKPINNKDFFQKTVIHFYDEQKRRDYPISLEELKPLWIDNQKMTFHGFDTKEGIGDFTSTSATINGVERWVSDDFHLLNIKATIQLSIEEEVFDVELIQSFVKGKSTTSICKNVVLDNNNSSTNISISPDTTLYENFICSKIAIALVEGQTIQLSNGLNINPRDSVSLSSGFRKSAEEIVNMVETLKKLNIDFGACLLQEVAKVYDQLGNVVNAVTKGKSIVLNNFHADYGCVYIELDKRKIPLFAARNKSIKKKEYYISDPYENRQNFGIFVGEEEKVEVPWLLALEEDEGPIFLSDYHLNQELVNKEFERLYCLENDGYYVSFSLLLINGYDQNLDYLSLEVAEKIIKLLLNKNPENSANFINEQQLKKRKGEILCTKKITRLLFKTENPLEKFACFTLLDDIKSAEKILNEIEKPDRENLKKWPIYFLYKKSK